MLYTFYESNNERVFIIEVEHNSEKQHINFIKFLIDKIEKETLQNSKLK